MLQLDETTSLPPYISDTSALTTVLLAVLVYELLPPQSLMKNTYRSQLCFKIVEQNKQTNKQTNKQSNLKYFQDRIFIFRLLHIHSSHFRKCGLESSKSQF